MSEKRTPYFSLILLLVLLNGCSSIEMFKEKTEFTPYKSYSTFAILNKETGQKGFVDPYLDAIVEDGLQKLLTAQGLVYDPVEPEIILRFNSNEDPRQKEIVNNMYPMWGYRIWDPWFYDPRFSNRSPVSTKNYELLQLIVDFIDPKNDKMLMRLTAVSEVTSEKDKRKKVIKSVEKVADTYQTHMQSKTR
ncbi:hypothetical protein A33Q_1152 [Indibacter alkaliphilus LW1]|uniref:DUF4136 domain-containing protein n=1 Tax=Indibacter alkaliphilus (strain CCUG 57479 / KCTC 22604 / LW1) TaxID=1189612 RepID=S2E884_INDAL|nr:DUF4136 domain-containing protein [Indibacter alkaliphilus]EOZ98498.1 hypothetical protein A33Q_1152 [Indibacter alkaliphilus LW1]